MDDLIVLILTLIIFVAGAVGQIKKKKAPQPVTGESMKPTNFWDLLEEETDVDIISAPSQEIIPEPYREEYESTEPENYQFTPVNEGGSAISQETRMTTQKKEPGSNLLRKEFSLRKAVIYSEILNRKYS